MATSTSDDPDKHLRSDQSVDEEPVRRFGWSDMYVHPDDDPRTDGGSRASGPRSSGSCVTNG